MERNLISWNFPNWFTVFLMGAGGYAGWAGIMWLIRTMRANQGG